MRNEKCFSVDQDNAWIRSIAANCWQTVLFKKLYRFSSTLPESSVGVVNVWLSEDDNGPCSLSRVMSSLHKVFRSDHVRDDREKNVVRGRALFVRFMERKGLGDCIRHFPECMTLGNLRSVTPHDLLGKYDIRDSKDRERIMKIMAESHREDQSDTEVRRWAEF